MRYYFSLLIQAIALGASHVIAVHVGSAWDTWTHLQHPFAAQIPVAALISIAGFVVWGQLTGRERLRAGGSATDERQPLFALSVTVGALLFFVIAKLGLTQGFSWGRLITFLLYEILLTPLGLIVSASVPRIEFRRLIRNRWCRRLLAATSGIILCGIMLACMEGVFYLMNQQRPPGLVKVYEGGYLSSGAFYQQDPDLGTSLKPNASVTCRLVVDGQQVWDARYTTDEFGRRRTMHPDGIVPSKFAIFFGCSFLFGEGSNDDQTIPSQFAEAAPDYRAYNYGVPGYGTQHMLAILESGQIRQEVTEESGLGLYLYLEDVHEARVVGDMDIVNSFGADFPYYELEGESEIRRYGQFSTGRQATNLLYELLGKSQTVKYLGLNFPRRSDAHYRLTAAIIGEARHRFLEQFPGSEFRVVFYPAKQQHRRLSPYLSQLNVPVIDLTDLFDPTSPEFMLHGDGHPTSTANHQLAVRMLDKVHGQ